MAHLVVAIDGFSGVGKSTVARKAAEKLGIPHLNSGFIYRALALNILRKGRKTSNNEDVLKTLSESQIELAQVADNTGSSSLKILLDKAVLGQELMEDSISIGASEVAKFVQVRDFACRLQREMAQKSSIVAEGRDAGTIVFPDAPFKFFLTASTKVAAKRRLFQLRPNIVGEIEKFPEQFQNEIDEVEAEIIARDFRDSTREIAPTVKADDAIEIDTSELTADEVVERIIQIVNTRPS